MITKSRHKVPYLNRCRILLIFSFILFCLTINKSAAEERLSEAKDKEVIELINNAKQQRWVREKVRYLLYEEQYNVKKDGRVTKNLHVLIKIFDERGKSYADVAIPYNSYYERCSVKLARTIQNNGAVQTVPKKMIQEAAPFGEFPFYSDFKIVQFSLPAVKQGSIIEYIVEVEEKKPIMKGVFSSCFSFEWHTFFSLVRLKIDLPKEMDGKFFVKGSIPDNEKEPAVQINGNRKTYAWQLKNFIQVFGDEPLRPPDREVGVSILFTTGKSWDEVADWVRNAIKGQQDSDENIISEVNNLTLNQSGKELSEEELIKRLFYFVSQNIRYVAVELGMYAWKPYPASEVLANLYGDCKGKAGLLMSMLKAKGIKSYYALIRTKDSGAVIPDIPSPFEFNHCLVAIPKAGGFIFLDPTPGLIKYGQLPPSDQGVEAFVITDEGYKFVKTPESLPDENSTRVSAVIKIKENGSAEISADRQITGIDDLIARQAYKYTDKQSREDDASKYLSASYSGGGKLLKFESSDIDEIETPFKTNIQYQANNFLRKVDNKFAFNISPEVMLSFKEITGGDYRKYAMWFPYAFSHYTEYKIYVPSWYKVSSLPEDINLDFPFASYSCSFRSENNKIYVNRSAVLKTREISKGKFGQFKNMIDKIFEHSSKEIILEKNEDLSTKAGEK